VATSATIDMQTTMNNCREIFVSIAILLLGPRGVWRSPPDVATCAVLQLVPCGDAIWLAITAGVSLIQIPLDIVHPAVIQHDD